MIQFAFTTILMFCLSAVLYLTVRALPRISEEPSERRGFLDKWAHSEFPEKVDAALNGFLLKFLRRLKVAVLKIDNTLSEQIRKVKPEENSKKPGIDFKEIAGQNKDSESLRG